MIIALTVSEWTERTRTMDRLTMDTTGKTGIGLTFDLDVSCANMDTAERLQDLIVRLGELEKAVSDSNGKYDIDRLRALAEADRDGRCVVLPYGLGAKLYRATTPYRQSPTVTEYTVVGFRTAGKRHKIQLEVRVSGVPGTNWMPAEKFCRTRAEAEAAIGKEQK